MKPSSKQPRHYQSFNSKSTSSISPQRKQKTSDIRVLRTNLVYAIGLWPEICSETILSNGEYFGKYGKVLKIAISKKPNVDKKGLRDPTYSAVITYDNSRSASLAVVSLFEFKTEAGIIRCCYGCTKYCDIFASGKTCNKNQCPYMHKLDQEKQIRLSHDEKYQDYDFQKHLNMATDLIFEKIDQIIDIFRDSELDLGVFPDPYDSMRILVDNDFITKDRYEQKWEIKTQIQIQKPPSAQKSLSNKQSNNSSSESVQNQEQIMELDIEQSICNRIINKLRKNKTTSILDFEKNKPTSPRSMEQFRSFFVQREVKQQ